VQASADVSGFQVLHCGVRHLHRPRQPDADALLLRDGRGRAALRDDFKDSAVLFYPGSRKVIVLQGNHGYDS
jgi:hypothetical protein